MSKNLIPAGTAVSEMENMAMMLIAIREKTPLPIPKRKRKKKYYPKPEGPHTRLEATASYKQYYSKKYR